MRERIIQRLFKFDTYRRIVQFLSFLFLSGTIFGQALPLLLPILWTWGLKINVLGDAFTALQLLLYEVFFPWAAMVSFLVIGVLLGKSLCGWICPFGFIEDLVDFIKRKKMNISPRTHKSMLSIKYGILAIVLLISVTFSALKLSAAHRGYENALGVFVKSPFTVLSPAETLFANLPNMILSFYDALLNTPFLDVLSGITSIPALFWVQLFILGSVLVFSAYVPRGWCKYFCPHAAIMGIMNRFSFLGLHRDPVKCTKGSCRSCVEMCPMNIRILDLPWEKFSDPECIYCLKCVDACPDKAIKLRYP
ncbi:MAG: 4Fe-4S binding protein [Candidatus Bathyarchaeota archaeon]|jgi:polyferredoxin